MLIPPFGVLIVFTWTCKERHTIYLHTCWNLLNRFKWSIIAALTLCIWADFQVCQREHDVVFSRRVLEVDSFAAVIRHAVLDEPESGRNVSVSSPTLIRNPPYFAHVGSLLRITWFPTTISRDRALVMATLNLCSGAVREGQEARNSLMIDLANLFLAQKCKTSVLVIGGEAAQTFSFERNPMLKSLSSLM